MADRCSIICPQEVFNGFLKIAQEELLSERFHQLQLKLEELNESSFS